jgi:hypothetical protein
MPESPRYHVFISHSNSNKDFVRDLADKLVQRRMRVWFDEWEIKPGDRFADSVRDGIRDSRYYVLVVEPSPSSSQKGEWAAALTRTWEDSDRTVIPIILPGASPPAGLRAWQGYAVENVTNASPDLVDKIEQVVRGEVPRDARRVDLSEAERPVIEDRRRAILSADEDYRGEDG